MLIPELIYTLINETAQVSIIFEGTNVYFNQR